MYPASYNLWPCTYMVSSLACIESTSERRMGLPLCSHTVSGRLACESLEDDTCKKLWIAVVEGYTGHGMHSEDRSAIVFSIGTASYTFFFKSKSCI